MLARSGSLIEKQLVTCCPSARMVPYLIIKTSVRQEELEGEEKKSRGSAVHFKSFVQSRPVAYESAGWEKLKQSSSMQWAAWQPAVWETDSWL